MNTPRLPGLAAAACCLSLLVAHATAIAGPLRDRLRARLEGQPSPAQTTEPDLDEGMEAFRASGRLPTGVVRLADRAYGPHSAQRYDVYLPSRRPMQTMPIIVMVHGGGWAHGDKAHAPVVDNKVRRWVPRNVALVSVNYPMLPETPPLEQARHVARALASVQRDAPSWGGDPRQVVLMGHSAGAHLVALLTAHPPFTQAEGALPWLGTVSLDSAAFDVVAVMSGRHLALYDRAFGTFKEAKAKFDADAAKLAADGKKVTASRDETIWTVAKREGTKIPHLCHVDLPGYRPDGNCRACVVEVQGERTLAPSIAGASLAVLDLLASAQGTSNAQETALP